MCEFCLNFLFNKGDFVYNIDKKQYFRYGIIKGSLPGRSHNRILLK